MKSLLIFEFESASADCTRLNETVRHARRSAHGSLVGNLEGVEVRSLVLTEGDAGYGGVSEVVEHILGKIAVYEVFEDETTGVGGRGATYTVRVRFSTLSGALLREATFGSDGDWLMKADAVGRATTYLTATAGALKSEGYSVRARANS